MCGAIVCTEVLLVSPSLSFRPDSRLLFVFLPAPLHFPLRLLPFLPRRLLLFPFRPSEWGKNITSVFHSTEKVILFFQLKK